MEEELLRIYKESMASMFGVSDTWQALYDWQTKRADECEAEMIYWRDKCEFYETLIKGEVI
jgi:hypothetical protein